MENEKELDNFSDSDLWAMKTHELLNMEKEMDDDPSFNEQDKEELKELIQQALGNMDAAITKEKSEIVEKEGKTK